MPRGLYTSLGQSLSKSKGFYRQAAAQEKELELIQSEGKREREQFDEMLSTGVEMFKLGKQIKGASTEKKQVAAYAEEQGLTKKKDAWWKPSKWKTKAGAEVTTADILATGKYMEMENVMEYGAEWKGLTPSQKRKLGKISKDQEGMKKELFGVYDKESGETVVPDKYKSLTSKSMIMNFMKSGQLVSPKKIDWSTMPDDPYSSGVMDTAGDAAGGAEEKAIKYLKYAEATGGREEEGVSVETPAVGEFDFNKGDVEKYASMWDETLEQGTPTFESAGMYDPSAAPSLPPEPTLHKEERERYARGVSQGVFDVDQDVAPIPYSQTPQFGVWNVPTYKTHGKKFPYLNEPEDYVSRREAGPVKVKTFEEVMGWDSKPIGPAPEVDLDYEDWLESEQWYEDEESKMASEKEKARPMSSLLSQQQQLRGQIGGTYEQFKGESLSDYMDRMSNVPGSIYYTK